MPVNRVEKLVGSMELGQSCWIVPWEIDVDPAGHMWVSPEASRLDEKGGTVRVKVTRLRDGLEVNISELREGDVLDHRVDRVADDALPVVRLIDNRDSFLVLTVDFERSILTTSIAGQSHPAPIAASQQQQLVWGSGLSADLVSRLVTPPRIWSELLTKVSEKATLVVLTLHEADRVAIEAASPATDGRLIGQILPLTRTLDAEWSSPVFPRRQRTLWGSAPRPLVVSLTTDERLDAQFVEEALALGADMWRLRDPRSAAFDPRQVAQLHTLMVWGHGGEVEHAFEDLVAPHLSAWGVQLVVFRACRSAEDATALAYSTVRRGVPYSIGFAEDVDARVSHQVSVGLMDQLSRSHGDVIASVHHVRRLPPARFNPASLVLVTHPNVVDELRESAN